MSHHNIKNRLPFILKDIQDYTDDDIKIMEKWCQPFAIAIKKERNILNRKRKINNILNNH